MKTISQTISRVYAIGAREGRRGPGRQVATKGERDRCAPPYTAITRSGYRARVPSPPKEVHVRSIVRLLVVTCLAATVLVPAAAAADVGST